MAGPGDVEGVTASMGELRVESEASSSRETEIALHENGDVVAAAEDNDDDIWGDASDSPGHESTLDREWIHRQNQFHKMGYRDGVTEGQKDSAQEGFNVGFRYSVHVGYKWGLVRGVTSALASLPDSLKEKLLYDVQRRGKLQDLHSSTQEISADDALQMFHDSIHQNNNPSGEPHITLREDGPADSNRLKSLSKDLVLLLHECPDIKVSEQLARDS
uniref:Essential protein Yae1 N-terminal domain-containing protein n=1 Tax=Arundo donax TaxID=35708 RepID=A0A0A9D7R8_ARUDO